jgi:hypothetical protein
MTRAPLTASGLLAALTCALAAWGVVALVLWLVGGFR